MTPQEFLDLRHGLKWSQLDTARALGISVAGVKSYEAGRRTISEPVARLFTMLAEVDRSAPQD